MFEGWFAGLAEALLSGGRLVLGAALAAVGRAARFAATAGEGAVAGEADEEGVAPHAAIATQKRMSGAVALESDAIAPAPPAHARPTRSESHAERDEELPVSPMLPCIPEADRLTIVARDPETLFAYWEIRPRTRAQALASLGAPPQATVREALRIRVMDADLELLVDLPPLATNRYVESVPAGRRLEVALGLVFEDRFALLAPPQPVFTPSRFASEDRHVVWRQVGADRRPSKAMAAAPTTFAELAAGFELPDLDGLASSSSAAGHEPSDGTSRAARRR